MGLLPLNPEADPGQPLLLGAGWGAIGPPGFVWVVLSLMSAPHRCPPGLLHASLTCSAPQGPRGPRDLGHGARGQERGLPCCEVASDPGQLLGGRSTHPGRGMLGLPAVASPGCTSPPHSPSFLRIPARCARPCPVHTGSVSQNGQRCHSRSQARFFTAEAGGRPPLGATPAQAGSPGQ